MAEGGAIGEGGLVSQAQPTSAREVGLACETKGGPAHPDDILRGTLQPRWRTGSPWLLDHCDEEAGREKQSSPTFDLQ